MWINYKCVSTRIETKMTNNFKETKFNEITVNDNKIASINHFFFFFNFWALKYHQTLIYLVIWTIKPTSDESLILHGYCAVLSFWYECQNCKLLVLLRSSSCNWNVVVPFNINIEEKKKTYKLRFGSSSGILAG